ncbi:hypothetical protein [Novosphingobium sp. AAP83]|uniref:hypothetical protein n=1 Tax=Novosphingobium sp. AAP83 TaxID=1523425 RepID=UPI001E537838|nr:hypothetical protein [Novosphingobium sp. AAP83]
MTIGWKLDREQRAALLKTYPPRYADVIADHVTLSVSGTKAPPHAGEAIIVGHADDGAGVEALVVAIEGSTARPDGKVWHVTWSLAKGRTARESNDVIARLGWTVSNGEKLILAPALW